MDRGVLAVPGGTVLGAALWHLLFGPEHRAAVPLHPHVNQAVDAVLGAERSSFCCLEAVLDHCLPHSASFDLGSFILGAGAGCGLCVAYLGVRGLFLEVTRLAQDARAALRPPRNDDDGGAPRPRALPPRG